MAPDDSEYGFGPDAKFEAWAGQPVPSNGNPQSLVLRYLAAFGPATAADAQTWSGFPKLKPVFDALRPKLRIFRDERNRELFDVPDAPRPPGEIPAPVRFLPAFDNLILSHADRTRIIADEYRPRVTTRNLQVLPTFLVDGFVAGAWDFSCQKKTATLAISPFVPIPRAAKQDLTAEAENLARFLGREALRIEVPFRK
jgi:hypothetical protein